MLILPTDPLFFQTMMRFVRTFVPTLTIHRVHVAERKKEVLSLQIEMTDGSLMFVEAHHQFDKIEVVLEYGWQRVDVWLYANFPSQNNGYSRPPSPLFMPCSRTMPPKLEVNGFNEVTMDGVIS